jgi:hypothetical protein
LRDTLSIDHLSQRLGSEKADFDSVIFAVFANLFMQIGIDGDDCLLVFGFHGFCSLHCFIAASIAARSVGQSDGLIPIFP